jgi:hypothetical protein
LHRQLLTGLEQQQRADDLRPGIDVQIVRQAVERVVLPRIVEIEDVVRMDADLADQRPSRFELGERRQLRMGFRLLRGCGGGRQRGGEAAAGQPAPN